MKEEILQKETLDKILNLLGPSQEEAAVEYRRLHQRLTRFFEWNGVPDPMALADEAIDRLAKRGAEEGAEEVILNPSAFALGIGRLLLQEEARRQQKKMEAMRHLEAQGSDSASEAEAMDRALQHCLAKLQTETRNLLEQYYLHRGGEKVKLHQRLAAERGLTVNALRNRALRGRQELEACMRAYLGESLR
jgi:DNA-directed RNA polymerase specialized sigma24 family protein